MGVRLLHSLCIYVIFYVIFVPRYQFGEQSLTWWPVINFYSSAACAVAFTTGNYVAGHPCHHKESHTFDWYELLPIYFSSQTQGHKVVHQDVRLQSSFEFQEQSFGGFKLRFLKNLILCFWMITHDWPSWIHWGHDRVHCGVWFETMLLILWNNFVNKM